MSLVTPDDVQARGIGTALDDTVLQNIIDEQEAWLARRIGPLTGARTETFEVGRSVTWAELLLMRYTAAVSVVDGAATLTADQYRLINRGSGLQRFSTLASGMHLHWVGPFVAVTYTPDDEAEVTSALYAFIAMATAATGEGAAAAVFGPFESEDIGDYSYAKASNGGSSATAAAGPVNGGAARAVIVSGLLPKRDPALSINTLRPAIIRSNEWWGNAPEPYW